MKPLPPLGVHYLLRAPDCNPQDVIDSRERLGAPPSSGAQQWRSSALHISLGNSKHMPPSSNSYLTLVEWVSPERLTAGPLETAGRGTDNVHTRRMAQAL